MPMAKTFWRAEVISGCGAPGSDDLNQLAGLVQQLSHAAMELDGLTAAAAMLRRCSCLCVPRYPQHHHACDSGIYPAPPAIGDWDASASKRDWGGVLRIESQRPPC